MAFDNFAEASGRMNSGELAPAVEIRLRYWIAMLQHSIADYSQMRVHAARTRLLASSDRERAIAGYEYTGKRDYAGAEKMYRSALQYLQAHPSETVPGRSLIYGNLAVACFSQAHMDDAAALFRACRTESAARYGVRHSYYLRCSLFEIRLLDRHPRSTKRSAQPRI